MYAWRRSCTYVWGHIYVCIRICRCTSFVASCSVCDCRLRGPSNIHHCLILKTQWKYDINVNPLRSDSFIIQTKEMNNYSFRIVLTSLVRSWCQIIQSKTFHTRTLEQKMTLENKFLDHMCDEHSSNLFFMFLPHTGVEWEEGRSKMVRGKTHGRMEQNVESVIRRKQKKLVWCAWTNTRHLKWKLFKGFRINSDRNRIFKIPT